MALVYVSPRYKDLACGGETVVRIATASAAERAYRSVSRILLKRQPALTYSDLVSVVLSVSNNTFGTLDSTTVKA